MKVKKASWIIRDENFYSGLIPGGIDYGQVMLTSQALVCGFQLSSPKDRDRVIKEAKRELLTLLLNDLMETEDWYEENQDRYQGLDGSVGSNDRTGNK